MKWTSVLASTALAVFLFADTACKTTPEKTNAEKATTSSGKKAPTNLVSTSRNDDVSFQAFLSRLRQAVHAHDANELAGMMTADFGYRLNPPAQGDGVFAYWDQNNLWPELELVLKEQFLVNEVGSGDKYMVAPAEAVTNSQAYTGYVAGVVLKNGSWKFAYFVSGKEETEPVTPL